MGPNSVKPETGISAAQTINVKKSTTPDIPIQNIHLKAFMGTSSIKQTLVSLGLTNDSLNKALLIFTRFFSIPAGTVANPAGFLTQLRREVLNTTPQENTAESKEGEFLKTENKALAAAALSGKGVKLNPAAMETYTQALDSGSEQFGGNAGNEKNNDESNQNQSGNKNNDQNRKKEPAPEELRALFDEFMNIGNQQETKSLPEGFGFQEILRILNRIPGENNQRWIVWPFNVTINSVELKVLIRLLLKEPVAAAQSRLFVNVAGPSNSWRFILDKTGGENLKINIGVYPERPLSNLKTLKKEAEKFFAPLEPMEIDVANDERFFSLAGFLEKEVMFSVNEEA